MTDRRNEDNVDTLPEELAANPDSPPASPPAAQDDEARSDIEQVVSARSDALERGEGGPQPDMAAPANGSDGIVRNQENDQQQ